MGGSAEETPGVQILSSDIGGDQGEQLTELEWDMTLKYLDKVSYALLGSAVVVYPLIHFPLKRAGIRRRLYIPFAAGVSFLVGAGISFKFTYDFLQECIALPPSQYPLSAHLHFTLKRFGLVYIHEDGKRKYSILSPSERDNVKETSTSIDLSNLPEAVDENVPVDKRTITKQTIETVKE